MSVYVDSMRITLVIADSGAFECCFFKNLNTNFADAAKSKKWLYKESCHLIADSIGELHEFAMWLGLKPSWFQNHPRLPHYDLTQNKRRLAVKKGAIEITTFELVSIMKGRK